MSLPDSDSSVPDLDPLFRRLREEPASVAVVQTALGLPARVAARLREEPSPTGAAYLRWATVLAPLTVACVAWAFCDVNELQLNALADPQAAGWLMLLFG